MTPNSITFDLPFPPSVNGLFPGKKRRYPHPRYKAWRDAAAPMVPGVFIAGRYTLDLIFDRPDRRARDLGNLEKACSDLLVSHGVVIDDSACQRITLAWSDDVPTKDAKVRVTVTGVDQ